MKPFPLSLFFALCFCINAHGQYACSGDQFMNGTIANIGMQCGSPAAQGYMKGANNLSDIQNASTSRTNLGLAPVAASGAYADLTGKPTIPTVSKMFAGSTTTNSSGIATFNISSAGFGSAPTACFFSATTGTGTPANSFNAVGLVSTAWTATQVQAYITQPITIVLGGLGVQAVGSGVTVMAHCDQ